MSDHRRTASPPEGLSPEEIETARFGTSFRGYSESEVRDFLLRASTALDDALRRIDHLERELAAARGEPSTRTDGDDLLEALSEETATVLRSAKEAAADLRAKADETATRLVSEAQDESDRLRSEARDESERLHAEAREVLERRSDEAEAGAAELLAEATEKADEIRSAADQAARERQREAGDRADARALEGHREAERLVDDARIQRQTVLDDLAARRALLAAQIEELRNGRDGLIDAFGVVKRTFLDATDALARVEEAAAIGELTVIMRGGDDPSVLEDDERVDDERAADLGTDADAPTEPASELAADDDLPAESAEAEGMEVEESEASEVPEMDEVDSLFERLRASRDDLADADTPVASDATPAHDGAETTEVEHADVAEAETEAEAAAEPFVSAAMEGRDLRLGEISAELTRAVKRAAQDEQNEVLDAVRRHRKGALTVEAAMGAAEAQNVRWRTLTRGSLDAAYVLGADLAAADTTVEAAPDDVADQLSDRLVTTLRDRLEATIDDFDGDAAELLDHLGAQYRQWRGSELDDSVQAALLEACSLGAFDSAPEGSRLVWHPPATGCSADCHDNALEPTVRGSEFPTGHLHPPAYVGCRCLAIPE